MPFTYADYFALREAYIKAERSHRDQNAQLDRTITHKETRLRPTEFAVRLRADAATSRLTLTAREKRLLYFDHRFARQLTTTQMDDPDIHLHVLARYLQTNAKSLQIGLDEITRILTHGANIEIEVDTHCRLCRRARHTAYDLPLRQHQPYINRHWRNPRWLYLRWMVRKLGSDPIESWREWGWCAKDGKSTRDGPLNQQPWRVNGVTSVEGIEKRVDARF